MLEEAISVISIWAYSLTTWFTPTVFFLLLNIVVVSIAATSGFATRNHRPNHHHQPPLQTQISRTSSLLQRFKSLNLHNYIPSYYDQLPQHAPPPQTTVPAVAAEPSEPPPPPEEEEVIAAEEEEVVIAAEEEEVLTAEEGEGLSMDEIYSMITQSKGNNAPHYGRQNSDTKPSGGEIPVRLPRKIKKSASDKSAFNHFGAPEETTRRHQFSPAATAVTEEEEAEEVDVRAADFISKFRRELQVQRFDSATQQY